MRKRVIGTELLTDDDGNAVISQVDDDGEDFVLLTRDQIPLMIVWLQEAYDTHSPRKTNDAQTSKTDG